MLVSERIFEILKEKNMTQKEFSKATGIAESTICDWKRKGLNPSSDKIPVICEALRVSPFYILNMEEPDYFVSLSADEQVLIERIRGSKEKSTDRLLAYLDGMSDSVKDTTPTYDDSDFYSKKQLCLRIRKLARLDRLSLDESRHASGLNIHLLKYLDLLNLDKLAFIKDYLSHLQPFMISEIKEQEKFENAICILDEYYRISVYIKIDSTKGEELVVSFHENNKNGIAKRNSLNRRNDLVYVFADSVGARVNGTDNYSINIFITRGVKSFPLSLGAVKYDEDGFMVHYQDINNALIGIMNQYLEDLYVADLDFSQIQRFTSLQELSFSSYGNDVFSNISLLIDSLIIQKDVVSRQIADSALCIYCDSISLTSNGKEDLLDTLKERFRVNSVKLIPEILDRVSLNLSHTV